jgi:crotonobetainyl-CoA:carnitine CoA-transferase CaiB-like acyl-CoA transferase
MNAGIELCFMTARCADGRYLQMCARQDHHFRTWVEVTGLGHRLAEPRYARAPMGIDDVNDVAALANELRTRMATRSRDEWMRVFFDADVGADPFLTPDEYLDHPQMLANGRVVTIDDPEVGPTRQVGPLVVFSDTPGSIGRPAPRLDEHRVEVLGDERWAGAASPGPAVSPGRAGGTSSGSPLAGVTVLETTMLATSGYAMAPYTVRFAGAPAWRLPDTGQHGIGALSRLYPCAAGWVFVEWVTERDWAAVAGALGHSEWTDDPRFVDPAGRAEHDAELQELVAAATSSQPAEAWESRARPLRAPLVAVATVGKDRWMEEHKLLIEASHPLFGEFWRPPVRVDFLDAVPRLDPASAAGEHTRTVLAELGRDRANVERLVAAGVVETWTPPVSRAD